jgi:hypothetical protein
MARANLIITQNTRHFPKVYMDPYGILRHRADDFLFHQCHLGTQLGLDTLDDQAAGIRKNRA